ncbi:MAG: hypothetical protein AMS27_14385 [Bacteroides sp. SM23_62_1]|nr:MAG: hypothetical protein AMS27_14385 [Bacteroides sp. SM23_62_1]
MKFTEFNDLIILSRLKKYTASGFIEDMETGERLIGATLFEYHSQKGTVSNNYGFFSLTTTEGEVILMVSYVGYQPESLKFILAKDTSLVIRLIPGAEIEEVSITSQNLKREINSSVISMNKITISSINNLPTLLGEGDIMKTMQFLPGIQFGSEASSGLVVRGGSPEQNLILLDGAPIYNSNHAFGLFSVFNSDAIKNLSLIKGGFPARYGGRLSSVIDVRMKEGNTKEYHGSLNVGTIASKFTLEGPIIKEKSSFIISARRTYVDLLLPRSFKEESDIPGFWFFDFNSKINHQLTKKDRLYLSFYMGKDRFTEEERFKSNDGSYRDDENSMADWGNRTSLLRWNHLFNSRLFSNLSVFFSTYGLTIDINEDEKSDNYFKYQAHIYNSGIKDISMQLDFDYYPVATHELKFGTNYIYHTFNPGELRKITTEYYDVDGVKTYPPSGNIDDISRNDPIYAHEFRAFMEDDFTFSGKFNTNIGIHYSGFLVDGQYYHSLEPRISASYPVTENMAVKGAYSRMKQYIHLLTHSGMGLPTDLWLPVTPLVKPQYSNQYTTGMVYVINDIYKLNIEGYYKSLHQIYEYSEGTDYLAANNTWENNIEMGSGRSYGIEFMLGKHVGKLGGWISYTYSKTDREFEEINNGKPFPYKYDRTHQANTVIKYTINSHLSVNACWIYATGMAYSLATQKYSSLFNLYTWNAPYNPSENIDVYKERNNARMPDYHRLDISVIYHNKGEKMGHTVNFSIYNTYGRFNPYLIYWDDDNSDYGKRKLKQVALFTIIPSLSYKLDF